jgi:hypothetical protein
LYGRGHQAYSGSYIGGAKQVEANTIVFVVYGLRGFVMLELLVTGGTEFAFEEGILDVMEVFAPDL